MLKKCLATPLENIGSDTHVKQRNKHSQETLENKEAIIIKILSSIKNIKENKQSNHCNQHILFNNKYLNISGFNSTIKIIRFLL